MDNLIYELKEVSFSYLGKYLALSGINMDIRQGQKVAVIGANGSGKSTLLHVLDGLIFPSGGSIKAFGNELNERFLNREKDAMAFRKKVGFVFQNPDVQLFCPTVKEDILFGPLQLDMDKGEIKKRLEELSGILGIGGLLDRAPHQLSIGEKHKVALASTLIMDPQVLILDEPTAGLDPLTARHIVDILIRENSRGKTVVTATHDLHIVMEISDIVYVFGHEKKIVRSGPPADILADTRLLECNNLIHVHSHKHKDTVHAHPHQHTDHHADGHTH